jgi:hypothetical protein
MACEKEFTGSSHCSHIKDIGPGQTALYTPENANMKWMGIYTAGECERDQVSVWYTEEGAILWCPSCGKKKECDGIPSCVGGFAFLLAGIAKIASQTFQGDAEVKQTIAERHTHAMVVEWRSREGVLTEIAATREAYAAALKSGGVDSASLPVFQEEQEGRDVQ